MGPVFHVERLFGNVINYILTGKPAFSYFALQIMAIIIKKDKKKKAININRHDPPCLSVNMFKNFLQIICISIKMTLNVSEFYYYMFAHFTPLSPTILPLLLLLLNNE